MSPGNSPTYPDDSGDELSFGLATAEEPYPYSVTPARPRSVLVTGARGFIGRHLLPRLVSRGHRVRAVSRKPAPPAEIADVEWRRADLTIPPTLRGIADGCDAIVHLVGILSEHGRQTFDRVHVGGTRNLLAEATEARVARFIFVSALGAKPTGSAYFRTKYEAELEVRRARPEYVILRPSVVYGPGDHFTSAVARLLHALPVFPMLGDGSFKLQPVAIEDLTDALCQAVERPDVADRVFELAGPERLSFKKIVRMVARVLRLRRAILPLPPRLATPALWLSSRLGLPAPITPAQLDMLRSGSVLSTSDNPLRSVFQVMPLPFRDALADYL
ncbi:MAG: complex I NDUFA9 subunit family protein [Gemmatimonadota bacterium]